jgi:hypothetical protein
MRSLQTQPKKNNCRSGYKTRYEPTMIKGFLSANIHVCYRHFWINIFWRCRSKHPA